MSLKCVGNQLLQAAPGRLLRGASTASASFWVQVAHDNNVVATGGVAIFGDSGGTFSAVLSGTGSLALRWSSNDGHANAVSTCSLALLPGKNYLVATTWQSGLQYYYLNGVQVGTDVKAGTLGVLGDVTPHAYRLGSDQAGADVTLDQPTLWAGYALAASDVAALLNGSAQPGGIAAGSIALRWSLAGTAGAPATIGDPGLADASPNALDLSSIVGGAPTYQAGDLTYVASPTIGRAAVAPSGKSIVLIAEDGNGVASGITSLASPHSIQSLAFIEPPAGDAFTLSFGGDTTAPMPVSVGLPTHYGLWTFPTVPGHVYDLAATFPSSYYSALEYGFETIDGGTVVARTILDTGGHGEPIDVPIVGFTDPGVFYADGVTLVPWESIAAGIKATGTTLQVRVTGGPAGVGDANHLFVDALRVQDTTTPSIAYYDDASTNLGGPCGGPVGDRYAFDGTARLCSPTGIGPIVVINGGAPALQAALEALPSIGAGNVLVADLSNGGGGNYQVTFLGALGYGAQPPLACADPNVSIESVNPGGTSLTLHLNGTPRQVYDWVWCEATPLPYAQLILPRSAPDSQTIGVRDLGSDGFGNWDDQVPEDASYSGLPILGHSAGLNVNFTFAQLPPGTYQLAVTYPTASAVSGAGNYTPSDATTFKVADGNGNTLGTYSVDQARVPADYTSRELLAANRAAPSADGTANLATAAVGWKVLGSITITSTVGSTLVLSMSTAGIAAASAGAAQPVAILDAVQLRRTSPDASIVIGPADVATVDIPAGFATCQAGAIPAIAGLALAPPGPNAILPPFAAAPKTMEVGYNVYLYSYASPMLMHSNMTYGMSTTWPDAVDPDGYPTRLLGGGGLAEYNQLLSQSHGEVGDGDPWQGVYYVNPGLYVMTWAGDPDAVELFIQYYGTSIADVTSRHPRPSNVTANWRVFDIQFDVANTARPAITIQFKSTTPDPADPTGGRYIINLSGLAIYPPDPSDPTGMTIWGLDAAANAWTRPPTFHPWAVEKARGTQGSRFLDPSNANNNGWSQLAHLLPTTHMSRCSSTVNPGSSTAVGACPGVIAVASIGPATPRYFAPSDGTEMVVKTALPHGLFDGVRVSLHGCGTLQQSGDSFALDNVYGPVHVIDETTLSFLTYYPGNGTPMTNATTGGHLIAAYGTAWPIEEMIEWVVVTGGSYLHFNAAITLDVTPGGGASQVAARFAALMPAGMRLRLEVGNECWNTGFETNEWCCRQNARMGNPDGTSFQAFYAQQAKATFDRFSEAFAAAGRPGDLIRVLGGMAAFPYITGLVLQEFAKVGGRAEELCVGPYFSGYPLAGYATDQLPIFNGMDADQLLDYVELNAIYGGYAAGYIGANRAQLEQFGYGAMHMMAYEWSPDVLVPPINPYYVYTTPNFSARQNAIRRHPRMYGIILQYLQNYQDAGLVAANWYELGGDGGPHGWDAWESGHQRPGTGDPVADAVNVDYPQARSLVLSQGGGAVHKWAGLVPPAATTTTTTTKKMVPGRNGPIRAIGFPRGVSRTVRSR